jgi:hypothetical protein
VSKVSVAAAFFLFAKAMVLRQSTVFKNRPQRFRRPEKISSTVSCNCHLCLVFEGDVQHACKAVLESQVSARAAAYFRFQIAPILRPGV